MAAAWQLPLRRVTLERHGAERAAQRPPSFMLGWLTLLRLLRLRKSGTAAAEKRRRPQLRWSLQWWRPRLPLRTVLLALRPLCGHTRG
jgi:hypothetical protein